MNMPIDVYHKGFTNRTHFDAFQKAVKASDCYDIAMAVNAEGAERKPVDAYVNALRMPRGQSGRLPPVGEIMTDQRRLELENLLRLAESRDEELGSVAGMPSGLNKLSYFLQDEMIPVYKSGKDYMTTKKSYGSVMAGDTKRPIIPEKGEKTIETYRDAAAYVHSDDPFDLWGKIATMLFQRGVPQRLQTRINDHDGQGQSRFTVYGVPFLKGIVGTAILYAGPVSFANKWYAMVPRPEQLCYEWLNEFLPMAYPEGSPMHPSRPAMHSFAALVCCFVLSELFDTNFVLDNGMTVGYELRLCADNVGYFRLAAGVHYASDHDDAVKLAQTVASNMVRPYIR